MDLGSFVLSLLCVSLLLNVALFTFICCGSCAAVKSKDASSAGYPGPDNSNEMESKTKAELRRRSELQQDDEVVIFKTGKVYHRSSCRHVRKAASNSIETRAFAPCKDCCK